MQRRTIKFSSILIMCLMLLIGCRKDVLPEEQLLDMAEDGEYYGRLSYYD